MNDREGFVSRWARRKREAAKGQERQRERSDLSATETADDQRVDGKAGNEMHESAGAPAELSVDLSKLPSIEEITAETDIRPFLARGVPSALRQAALRKLWVADPSIRDFIEIAENQWDFNAPGGILGFDHSLPVGDVKRMVAEMLGNRSGSEPEPKAAAATEEPASAPIAAASDGGDDAAARQTAGSDQASIRQTVAMDGDADTASQNDADIATQQTQSAMPPRRRSHGRAMPS